MTSDLPGEFSRSGEGKPHKAVFVGTPVRGSPTKQSLWGPR